MTDTVYASTGGERYHRSSDCLALMIGQEIRAEYTCDCPGRCKLPIWETTPSQARADGKTPCRVCLPKATALSPSEDSFGHEPVANQYRGQSCRRCTTTVTHYDEAYQPSRWTRPVPWPCGTAVLLGIAPAA